MAITSFIPKLWEAALITERDKYLVAGSFFQRNYSGMVQQGGNVIAFNKLKAATVKDYVKGSEIVYEDATTTEIPVNIDQSKYFAVKVDDVDAAQAAGDLKGTIGSSNAMRLAAEEDKYLFDVLSKAATGANVISETTITDSDSARKLVTKARAQLLKNDVNTEIVGAISPDFEALLIQDPNFIAATAAGMAEEVVRAGFIGMLYGVTWYRTTNLPTQAANKDIMILTTPMANVVADQLQKIEALVLPNTFGEGIRGLNVYGAGSVEPDAVVVAKISYTAPAGA